MMAAIEWFRLWHDMPNDPKWRTIARASGQPISVVLAVALHIMTDASRNVTRGHVDVTAEDVASAIDVTDDAVESIFSAMQGRILDGDVLTGWTKRQPKREELGDAETGAKSATQRKREERLRKKEATESCPKTDVSRDVTQCHEKSRIDKDTDKEKDTSSSLRSEEEREPQAASPPPAGQAKKSKRSECTLSTYLAECKATGVKAVPDGHAIRRWAQDAGIDDEMLHMAWIAFRERYTEDAQYAGKLGKDWPGRFANSVKDGWFGLWFVADGGAVQWSSKGLLRKQALEARHTAQQAQPQPQREVSDEPA